MTEQSGIRPSRRDVLRLGSLAVAGALAGCSFNRTPPQVTETPDTTPTQQPPEPTPRPLPYDLSQFETVVNMVDVGADPTGTESILPLLTEHAGSNTALYFPHGRYLMDDIWELRAFENFGIVGNSAIIVPPAGYDRYLFNIGSIREPVATSFLFAGIRFDFSEPNTSPRPLQVAVTDGLLIKDIIAIGSSGTARFSVTDPSGSGLVERLQLHNDGDMDAFPAGCFVGPDNHGELTFKDCHIIGFPNNGLYASSSVGPINVIGGFYQNNGIANVRVSSPAVVRGVYILCDASPPGFQNMRGIRLRNGASVLVEDCTIEIFDVTYSEGAIVIESLMESATIRNTQIITSADGVPGIHAKTLDSNNSDGSIHCESVRIRGDARGDAAIRIVDRDNCVFEDVSIVQSGANRDGFHLLRANNTLLRNVEIAVTKIPVVVDQSEFVSENVTISLPR
ncbi:hypothetical protein ACFQH3_01390 [Haladaptatus sp. GCM10025707]|uniref:hypothetical protein n=1 Tax=unclassified Haladaptatus TaxID=2622732 RepID=UPI0023E84DEF|nr:MULTISPECIES: hypothetical protein [unclassified Haladaptatus]